MLRPMQARGFMPAGDLPSERICASVSDTRGPGIVESNPFRILAPILFR